MQDRTLLYCETHGMKVLRRLRRRGYLEPLKYRTQDGQVRLSPYKFLVLEEDAEDQLPQTSPCKSC